MNPVIRAMIERRSIRSFKPDMPSRQDITSIIEAGLYAPSGMNRQSSIVVAVTAKELRDRIAADNCRIGGWKEEFDPFYGAPVILIVLADTGCPNRVYDGSLTMGNMLLAAHALGLGAIWIHRAKQEFESEFYRKLLADIGVSGEYEGIGHCAVGYIQGDVPKPAQRCDGRVYWIE